MAWASTMRKIPKATTQRARAKSILRSIQPP
jgi:hypothetical protein